MSDFGLFESDEAAGLEPRVAARTAARRLEAAIDEVRAKFGPFLLGATGIDEFGDRWHYSKADIRKTVEPYVHPATGTMRRVMNAMKADWKLAHPYKLADDNSSFMDAPGGGSSAPSGAIGGLGGQSEFSGIGGVGGASDVNTNTGFPGEIGGGAYSDGIGDFGGSRADTSIVGPGIGSGAMSGVSSPPLSSLQSEAVSGFGSSSSNPSSGGGTTNTASRRQALSHDEAGFGSMPEGDHDHRNQNLKKTYHPSDGNLIPSGDFESWKDSVDQGGPEKVDAHAFTPGGDSGSAKNAAKTDGLNEYPRELDDDEWYDEDDEDNNKKEAARLVADIYTDFAQSNGLRVASLDTLDLYAQTGIHEDDYRLLQSMIVRTAEADCEDEDDEDTEDSDDDDSDTDSAPPSPPESDDSGESDDEDDEEADDAPEPSESDSDDESDSEGGEAPDFGGDDTGGDVSQTFTVPEQAPELSPDLMGEIPQDDTDGSAPVPPEVIDSLLGLPEGTIEQLLLEEVEQGAQGGDDQFGGAPEAGGDDFFGGGGGDEQGPPPHQLARRRRAAFGQDDMTDEEMWGEYERQREDAIHEHGTEPHPGGGNVHTFRSTGEGYDKTQYLDSIKHGDILHVPDEGVVGFLHEAWPVSVTQQTGVFHDLKPEAWSKPEFAHAQKAVEFARQHGYPLDPNISQTKQAGRQFWAAPDESEEELTERQKRDQKDSIDTKYESWIKSKTASQKECDICKHEYGHPGVPAVVDGKTRHGLWAFMCPDHFKSHGIGLGTGRGQHIGARSFWAADDDQSGGGDSGGGQQAPAQDPAAQGMDPAAMGGGMLPPPGSQSIQPPAPAAPLENQPAEDQLLDMASQAITQMIDRETSEFQQIIDPLTQALQAVQFAQQVEQSEHPLDVTPPQGTVNVDPSAAPAAQANPMQQQAMRRQAKKENILAKAAYVIARRHGLSESGYRDIVAATLGRRDYEHILEAVRLAHPAEREDVGGHLAHLFAAGNPRFNKDVWMKAVMASKPRDRAWDAWASGRDRGDAEHARHDLDDREYDSYSGEGDVEGRGGPVGYSAGPDTPGGRRIEHSPAYHSHPDPGWRPTYDDVAGDPRFSSRGRRPFDRPRLAGETWKNMPIPDTFEFENDQPQSRDNMTINDLPKMPGGHVGSSQRAIDRFQRWENYRQQRGLPAMSDDAEIHNFQQTSKPYKLKVGDEAEAKIHRDRNLEPDSPKAPKVKVPKAVNPVLKGKGTKTPAAPKPTVPKTKAAARQASFFTRKVPGWRWDDHLSGYISKEGRAFTCSCGEKVAAPSYKTCSCGKVWNVYAIGDTHHLASDSAEMFIAREIPVRENVIMANRKMAGDADDSHQKLLAMIDKLADWTKYDDPEDPVAKAYGKSKIPSTKAPKIPRDWSKREPDGKWKNTNFAPKKK